MAMANHPRARWQPSEKAKIILQRMHPNVSKEKLTLNDLRFVVKALKTLSARWEDIGMAVDVRGLDEIKRNYQGTYKRLIAVINSWLSENFHPERDGSNAPSWWKIVDVVADDIGGDNPNLAKNIAQNWRELGKDNYSSLAMSASSAPFVCCEGSKRLINEIARALQGVASNWFEVCTLLGIPVNKLNSIREECDRSTEACLKGAIKEWLSGRYSEADGYPTPSVRVLVDVVEHQAGGANPALAKDLAKMTFQHNSTTDAESTNGADSEELAHTRGDRPSDSPPTHPGHDSAGQHERQSSQTPQSRLQEALHRNLDMSDLFEITKYLGDMDNEQLINLGGALGLRYTTLGRMKTLPNEMVAAWLRREEGVLKRSGEPTYERLAEALEEMDQTGLAKDVREQKYAKHT